MTGPAGWSPTPVFGAAAIREVLAPNRVMAVVRDALIAHARGQTQCPPPGQLLFTAPPGDCHIKYGRLTGGEVFAVKVATGFYDNAARGLPVNNGVVLLFSASTGELLAILQDEGWLTSLRTAAAGALAAVCGASTRADRLGIVGTGHQSELQATWAVRALGGVPVTLWGRDPAKTEGLAHRLRAQGLEADPAKDLDTLFAQCQVVITCTPATRPIVSSPMVRPGTHLVCLGADSPGKVELAPGLFRRVTAVATDDHAQCLAHGDFGHAVRAGAIRADADVALGAALDGAIRLRQGDDDITVVDLTGVAAQDVAIASLCWSELRLSAMDQALRPS